MKKLKQKSGVTLIEMLVAILVLVFIIIGMNAGTDAGTRIYNDSVFESDCATLSGILNTAIGDILRYSQDVRRPEKGALYVTQDGTSFVDESGTIQDTLFVFTNVEYGVQDAYFYVPLNEGNGRDGMLQMKNLRKAKVNDVITTGAYPNLKITDFDITYVAPGEEADGKTCEGGYFNISYTLSDLQDTKTRDFECCVRMINP